MGTCTETKAIGETCDPLDWGACTASMDPDVTIACDAVQKVCTIGEPLCPGLNLPSTW
ncbi:MAG TPA: hypothetical protein VFG69_20170 [Nannocystaceae bacterium]|nr:hypothetical protein [Nannocystaceae bacterium]